MYFLPYFMCKFVSTGCGNKEIYILWNNKLKRILTSKFVKQEKNITLCFIYSTFFRFENLTSR